MGFDGESWIEQVKHFEAYFPYFADSADQMTAYENRFGRKWSRGEQLLRGRVGKTL